MNLAHNPEFRRNVWLEITPQRLLAAPLILGLLVLIAWGAARDAKALQGWLAMIGAIGFFLVTALWGAKLAAESLSDEFAEGTWDSQRTSALRAGEMILGKMFGGASFAWYIGAWCLLLLLVGGIPTLAAGQLLRALVGLLSLALFTQALALLSTLLAWRKLRSFSTRRSRGLGLILAFVVLPNLLSLLARREIFDATIDWYGMTWTRIDFLLLSLLAFTFWSLLGAHRAMRAELQFRNQPWTWIAFVLFLQVYLCGFVGSAITVDDAALRESIGHPAIAFMAQWTLRLGLASGIAMVLGYCFLFAERKDPLRLRQLASRWPQETLRQRLEQMPIWAINFGMAAAGTALMLLTALASRPEWHSWIALAAGSLSILLFAVRDAALVLWCNLGNHQRRADAAAMAYLLVLYGLLPILLGALGLKDFLGLVQPYSAFVLPLWIVAALAWAAAGLDLLRRRWQTPP